MHYCMKVCLTLTDGHSPLLSRGLNEHHPRDSAGQPHHIEKASDGMRTVSVLVAVPRIADRLINLHTLPVGIQFVSQNHGKSRANYRAHFRAMSDNPDSSVSLDAHKNIGMKGGVVGVGAHAAGLLSPQYVGCVINAYNERSGASQSLEKPTPTHIFNRAHANSCAAALMAARMR